jgi:gas vesicle protein
MNDRMAYATSIVCFLAGGIAGATAALLLAPQSGRATRETMARKVGDTADSARGMKDRVLQKGGEIWGEATHRVSDAASALSGGDGHKGAKPDKSASV